VEREHYTIYPLQGFGLLRFGQSIAEAKKFTSIYGDIEAESLPLTEERIKESDQYLRNAGISEEDIDRSRADRIEKRKDNYTFTFKGTIILFFHKDELVDIRLSDADFPAYLGEKDLFALYGEPVAHYTAYHLNENPYLWEKAMFFVKHSIALDGYFDKFDNSQILWRGPLVRKEARGIFLGPESREDNFDYNSTTFYKILP